MEPDDFSNGWLLLAILISAFAVGLYTLREGKFVSRKKKVEFLSLAIAALGLFGLLANNRVFLSDIERDYFKLGASGESSYFDIVLSASWACLPMVRSESSPSNFDQLVASKIELCEWQRSARDQFKEIDLATYPPLPAVVVEGYPESARVHFSHDYEELQKGINRYNAVRSEYALVASRTKLSVFEILLQLYAPFLLATAFGFTGAKIYREPKHAH